MAESTAAEAGNVDWVQPYDWTASGFRNQYLSQENAFYSYPQLNYATPTAMPTEARSVTATTSMTSVASMTASTSMTSPPLFKLEF